MLHIAISPCFMPPDPSRTIFARKWLTYVENQMVRYVAREGVLPFLVPQVDNLAEILESMAGLVLPGGTDVSPRTYGRPHLDEELWPGDEHRDDYELKILAHFVKAGKPVLGICRGCQLLNVYFGGTLTQDIATEHPDPRTHRCVEGYDQVRHHVALTPGGLLDRTLGRFGDAALLNILLRQLASSNRSISSRNPPA